MVAVANNLAEINSFVSKFSSLWKTGKDACLQIETHAGQACVTLRLGLGEYPGNQRQEINGQNDVYCEGSTPRRKISPSKMRCRARRAAARASTAESVVEKKTENIDSEVEEAALNQEIVVVGNVDEYVCDQCDFSSRWINGLKIHVSVKHEISLGPLDVPKTDEDREVHELAQSYWKSGILAKNLQVYIKALVDVEKAVVDDDIKEVEEKKLEKLWKGAQSVKLDSFPP